MNLLFTSISGNTRAFVGKLQEYAAFEPEGLDFEAKEIQEQSSLEAETAEFVALVPTYLDGGNGIDNGDTEIMTEALGEYIEHANNYRYCLGVIGSGNKNFNHQYCLTAKMYAERFHIPFLADFELRGTPEDVARIYEVLVAVSKKEEPLS